MSASHLGGKADSHMGASLIVKAKASLVAVPENFYHFVNWRRPKGCDCKGCELRRRLPEHLHAAADIFCRNAFIAWEEAVENLVTTEGKNDLLTNYLKGSAYTAAFFIGLVDNANFTAYVAGDTAAQINGTNGWKEGVPYSNATRPAWTGGTAAAGSIDNSGSPAAFNINATLTVRGAFLVTTSAKSGTTGKIYGEADFTAARSVLSGDTLNGTIACTV
jgi:hypothetical protein